MIKKKKKKKKSGGPHIQSFGFSPIQIHSVAFLVRGKKVSHTSIIENKPRYFVVPPQTYPSTLVQVHICIKHVLKSRLFQLMACQTPP